MSDYVPGSWAKSRDAVPEGHVQITIYEKSTGIRVATVFEREAYADMIVALPETLKSLKDLEEAATARENTMGDPLRLLECQDAVRRAARAARAALATAGGRS